MDNDAIIVLSLSSFSKSYNHQSLKKSNYSIYPFVLFESNNLLQCFGLNCD